MEQGSEIIKPIVRVGNSAGVILPREWLNGKARIELLTKPINIKKDVIELLDTYLWDVLGVYLVGSYSRGEETKESDVDILVITSKTNLRINKERYNLLLISRDKLENAIKNLALPIIPMLKEGKTLLNKELIENYKKKVAITKDNAKPIIELAKSALDLNKSMINLDKEWPSNSSDATSYSLVLNIRSLYLINRLRNNKRGSNKGLKSIIKQVSGSSRAYEGYLRVKSNKKDLEDLPIKEADKLCQYLANQVEKEEKWLKEKKG